MAKGEDKLGDAIAAGVKAQFAPLTELAREIRGTVGSAAAELGTIGPLVKAAVREATDVETLKALADPTRLAILRVLMSGSKNDRPVMSAKELAEELDAPQTKLYRHLKVLEAAGLIEVAETRIVSGIVETRYRAAHDSLFIDPDNVDMDVMGNEVLGLASAGIEEFRRRFVSLAGADRILFGADIPADHLKGVMMISDFRVSRERADEYRARLAALVDDITAEPVDPDGVPMEALLVMYSALPPDASGDRKSSEESAAADKKS